jgi:hypothetical protein
MDDRSASVDGKSEDDEPTGVNVAALRSARTTDDATAATTCNPFEVSTSTPASSKSRMMSPVFASLDWRRLLSVTRASRLSGDTRQ